MSAKPEQVPTYRFGSFELDRRNGELRKFGVRIKLQDHPREILELLLDHASEVVTREEIQKHLWPDHTFVDFDNAINSAVRKLRQALGDSAENPRFVETVARRGYRFVAPVSTNLNPGTESATEAAAAPDRVGRIRLRRLQLTAVTIGLAVLAVAAARLGSTARTSGSVELRVSPLTSNRGLEIHPALSPDGSRVAYAWRAPRSNHSVIYTKVIGAGDPIRATLDEARDFSPAWSPDGRFIAALRDLGQNAAIVLIPSSGGRAREVARIRKADPDSDVCVEGDLPRVCGLPYWGALLAWTPDGKYLLTSALTKPDSPLAIVRIAIDSGEVIVITSPQQGVAGDFGPAISPDGKNLAFCRATDRAGDLYVAPLSGAPFLAGKPKRITFDGVEIEGLAWTADGNELVFSSKRSGRGELWRVAASGQGQPVRVANVGEGATDLTISPGRGRLVYSRSGGYRGSLWKLPLNGLKAGQPVLVTASTARDKFSDFSPDGSRIVFESGRSGVDEIWTCDPDGANAVQLTNFGRGISGSPRWSPDGSSIAFDSNVTGRFEIYVIPAQGGQSRRLTKDSAFGAMPSWSRDSQWVYFTSPASGRDEVWKVKRDGSVTAQVTHEGAFTAAESTDGKALYVKRGGDEGELWKMSVGGGALTKVVAPIRGRYFTVTDRGIYFAGHELELRYFDFASGMDRAITPLALLAPFGQAAVSADRRWVLYPMVGSMDTNLMLVENFR